MVEQRWLRDLIDHDSGNAIVLVCWLWGMVWLLNEANELFSLDNSEGEFF